jgi:hypothetical protein
MLLPAAMDQSEISAHCSMRDDLVAALHRLKQVTSDGKLVLAHVR